MPRSIESYSKKTVCREAVEPEGNTNCNLVSGVIILVFSLFLVLAVADSRITVIKIEKSISEQAKVCLAEFSKMKCNSLDLTSECQKLLNCIQLQEDSAMDTVYRYLSAISKEIQEDYLLPAFVTGLLLLFQLNQNLHRPRNITNDL